MKKSSMEQDASKSVGAGAVSASSLKVTVFWGDILYDTAICGPNQKITLGRKAGSTFVVDTGSPLDPKKDSVKLVEVFRDHTAELQFDDKFDGHVRIGSDFMSLGTAKGSKHVVKDADGFYKVKLSQSDKADVVLGNLSFYFDWVKGVEVLPPSRIFTKKRILFLLPILTVLGLFVALLTLIEVPPEEEKPPERLVTLLPKNAPANAAMGQKKTADGGSQKGDIGKAEVSPTPVAAKKPSAVDALKKANLGNLVSGLTNLGNQAPHVEARTNNTGPVDQVGTGGFSTEGLKTGGGGKSVGIGRTVGQGQGGFEGTGHLGLSGNSVGATGTGHGGTDTKVAGGLDSDVIESVIRRRLDRIRLCYERQLNFNPKLAGKISVHFVIGKTGDVVSSRVSEDTMKNENVKNCIVAEVRTWTFPRPEGGTMVNVDYPFVFESSSKR